MGGKPQIGTSLTHEGGSPYRLDLDQGLPGGNAPVMLQCTVVMAACRSKQRNPRPLAAFSASLPVTARVAIHQLAHGRNGDRAQGGARDIVDFAEHLPQGLALRLSLIHISEP